jgi:hypothetical protein
MNKPRSKALIFVTVVAILLSTVNSALAQTPPVNFYISADSGQDTNPGSLDLPFKTLKKAQDTLRTLNKTMSEDITVYLRGGRYELTETLALDTQDSGMNGHTIIYKNYLDETALISGGRLIHGWQKEGNLWKVDVGTEAKTRELYVNNQPAIRARNDQGLPDVVKTETGYTTTDTSMQNWRNPSAIEIVGRHYWKLFRCGIQSIKDTTITIQQPCWNRSQLNKDISLDNPSWLENAYELLDSPGEWYLDNRSGWLYYLPRPNEDMSTATVVLPRLETLIQGLGTPEAPIHHIKFEGLMFAEATWLRPSTSDGFPPAQAAIFFTGSKIPNWSSNSDIMANAAQIPGHVNFKFAKDITFTLNTFTRLGATGLNMSDGSQDNVITGNHFYNIGSNAISVGDIINPNTSDVRLITKNIKVSNNYIHNIANQYEGSVGIEVGYTENVLIQHNQLSNLPYSGISIGWGWGVPDPTVAKNNTIQANLIDHPMSTLSDGGGIYSLGAQPGNIISENIITNQSSDKGAALYLDNRSRYITVVNNVIFNNTRSLIVKGGDHNIHDNWWQERYPNDLYFVKQKMPCQPTECGPNTLADNNLINSLTDAPSSLVQKAGLEEVFKNKLMNTAY